MKIETIAAVFPAVLRYLDDDAYAAAKTEQTYLRQLWERVKRLYENRMSGSQFITDLADIVQQQITRAYRAALRDEGLDPDLVNGEYKDNVERIILSEYDHVDGFTADIIKASTDGTGYEQFRVRAEMWANRYNDAYNKAELDIALENGGKLEWQLGETEEHCDTCAALHGKVAFAAEWQAVGLRPQNPPNQSLDCGGWQCDCHLIATNKRRTYGVQAVLLGIIGRREIKK